MKRPFVAVSDSVFPSLDPAQRVLTEIDAELHLAGEATPDAILAVARNADALMVTYAKISGDMIRQMTRCRIISRMGIGVDNLVVPAATESGILITKVPDYCMDEVSDHAMALLLALGRKIAFSNSGVQSGRWEMRSVVPIHRLRGSVLGLVGFGRIPRLVVPKAQGFGLKVIAFDPYVPADVMASMNVAKVEFSELLRKSDYISIHSPLSPQTQHLFNADAFQQIKPTAYLVNTARGPIVDENALAQALDNRQLAGAALDVLEQEPPSNSPLLGRDNVILAPHTAFYSEESLLELQTKAAEEVVRAFTGKAPRNPVNPEVLQSQAR